MKKTLAIIFTAAMLGSITVTADEGFDRIIAIDSEINDLISERDGIVAGKIDTATPLGNYETKYTDGQYKIGEEIPAGEYVFFSTGKYGGSLKETIDSNGSDRVDSEYYNYCTIYTLTEGNYVELKDTMAVPSADVTELLTNKESGAFKVGVHIPAGEYRLINTRTSGGSYKIWASSNIANGDDRISSDYFSTATYVTVHDGEYLYIENALFIE